MRARFQIPLSIRACGFPAHGSPTVFLTPQRTRQRHGRQMPPAARHHCEGQEHRHPNPATAWRLPIARARVVAYQRPKWPHRPFHSEPRRRAYARRGGWERSCRPCPARTSLATTTEVRALRSRRVLLHADPHYYGPLGLPLPSARLHHRLIRAVFADEAGQTGLPCSLTRPCARATSPTPRGPTLPTPEQRTGGHGLRRDVSGSAPRS
jgi:hypothetical protein